MTPINVKPSLEFILRQFRSYPGLYVLGAGTSAGTAPLGRAFWTASSLDFLRNLGGFSVSIPVHSELTRRIIDGSSNLSLSEIFPGRAFRFEDEKSFYLEILERLPDYFARTYLKHLLAKANFSRQQSDSYRIFHCFRPSLIANYNHDGLATRLAAAGHRVVEMHGSVERGYGSPEMAKFLEQVREYHLTDVEDGLVMGVPESYLDLKLARNLQIIGAFSPAFIAIIGYSFARYKDGHDDQVSLDYFKMRFQGFPGNIYIVDPAPECLQETLADAIRSRNVFPIRAYWNVLAHVFMGMVHEPISRKSLSYLHQRILDRYGGGISLPLARGE
ncbi:MAG: hypothetical protein ACLPTF_25280 [Steroidobacteraceae bacterium]